MPRHEINKFTIHQFKGVRGTIEISPNGPGCLIIAGPNGAGKSSVVDGIMQIVAPAGVKGPQSIPRPVHEGEKESFVEFETNEIRARRTFKPDGTSVLVVRAHDGANYGSPKAFLVKATGGQVFDTAAFSAMESKDQRTELLRRVELPFDVDELDEQRKAYFDGRTEVGRDVAKLEAQLKGYAPADPGVPTEEASAAAVLAEYESARQHNASIDQQGERLAAVQTDVERAKANVERLVAELDEARTYLTRANEVEAELHSSFSSATRIDTDAISARLAAVEETNTKVRAQAARAAVAAELATKTADRDGLTAKIEAIDKQKQAGLAAAKFPVDGLGIDDTGITHNNVPFRQINAAMQIIVAFDLFTQDRPDLRIIFIKNGDLLDATSLAGIEKIAIERGYYVVVERDRDESREIGFTIRDGELAA